jgi:outer membrane protein, multidrug efflux system
MRDSTRSTKSVRRGCWPVLLVYVFLLPGCTVGPKYQPPSPNLSAGYSEGPATQPALAPSSVVATPPDARWWPRFDDPILSSLIERAISANPNVAVAQARVREARSMRKMVESQLYPQFNVGASVLRARVSESALGLPHLANRFFEPDATLFQLGFDAYWALDVFGGTRRQVESARAGEEATDAARRGVLLMIAAETARAYMELRGTQRQLQVANSTLESEQQTLELTRDKHVRGLASDLDMVRARGEVESTTAQIPPLEQAVRERIHVLSTLLGLTPTALAGELEPPATIPQYTGDVAAGVPSDLLRRRPDIQRAERQIAGATAMVGAAVADLYPKVLLGGAAGVQGRTISRLFNVDGGRSPTGYYATGPFINWTLFDGGRRRAAITLNEAEVDAAKASYEDTVLRAFREVESALVAVDQGRSQRDALRQLSVTTREGVGIARRDYQNGVLDQLSVLDAQRQADRADILLAQSETSLAITFVMLHNALGGGWEVAEPSPTSQPAPQEALDTDKEKQ